MFYSTFVEVEERVRDDGPQRGAERNVLPGETNSFSRTNRARVHAKRERSVPVARFGERFTPQERDSNAEFCDDEYECE